MRRLPLRRKDSLCDRHADRPRLQAPSLQDGGQLAHGRTAACEPLLMRRRQVVWQRGEQAASARAQDELLRHREAYACAGVELTRYLVAIAGDDEFIEDATHDVTVRFMLSQLPLLLLLLLLLPLLQVTHR